MPEDSGVKQDTEQLIQIKAPQHQRVFHFGLPVSEECRVANRAPVHPAEPMGLPSPEALQVATDVIRRRCRPGIDGVCSRGAKIAPMG